MTAIPEIPKAEVYQIAASPLLSAAASEQPGGRPSERRAFFRVRKEKRRTTVRLFSCLAERTGLEPATPGVTGRYSNQLNYRSKILSFSDSGPASPDLMRLVGAERLELPTFAL